MSAEQYIEYVYLDYLLSGEFDDTAGEKWIPFDQMHQSFLDAIENSFAIKGYDIGTKYREIAENIFNDFVKIKVVQVEGDEFTGQYAKFSVHAKDVFVKKNIGDHPVGRRIDVLGAEALSRALAKIASIEGWGKISYTDDIADDTVGDIAESIKVVPASDRIVTLNHNQIDDLEAQTSEIIDSVSTLNQIENDVGVREMVIGQLKAGRELLRAGSFKAYLLQVTLIDTLLFLAKKYEKETVGALASALIAALLKHFGVDG